MGREGGITSPWDFRRGRRDGAMPYLTVDQLEALEAEAEAAGSGQSKRSAGASRAWHCAPDGMGPPRESDWTAAGRLQAGSQQ